MNFFLSRNQWWNRTRIIAACTIALSGVLGSPARVRAAAEPQLLDINKSVADTIAASRITRMGEFVLFAGVTNGNGKELWRSDGTSVGTNLVADIWPGPTSSRPSWIFVLDDVGYFAAEDPEHGEELWRTDGTRAGTWLVADIVPGVAASAPHDFAEVGGDLYFRAWSPETGTELWHSDGTAGGTRLVADIRPGAEDSYPRATTALDDRAVFFADDGLHGLELWVTDGSTGGTKLLRDIRPGAEGSRFWHLLGRGKPLLTLEGEAYFAADDGVHGRELWKTDGTKAGTVLVADVLPGPDSSDPFLSLSYKSELIFTARVPGETQWTNLKFWATDGTEAGTRRFAAGVPAGSEQPVVFQEKVWATSRLGDEGPVELWATDGTRPGSKRMALLTEVTSCGSQSFLRLTPTPARLFFVGHERDQNVELWSSDGTEAGTGQVSDIVVDGGSHPRGLTPLGDQLLYLATDLEGNRPFRLWRSDGTEIGTERIMSDAIGTASSLESGEFATVGDTAYFFADSGNGRRLYRSDGSEAGTEGVPGFDRLGAPILHSFSTSPFAAAKDSLYVRTHRDIWRTDGTQRGLEHVLFLDEFGDRTTLAVLDDSVFFDFRGDLWRGDGRETINLTAALPATTRSAEILGVAGRRLFFLWSDLESGRELWSTDGTVAGTRLHHDLKPGAESGFDPDGEHLGIEAGPLFYFVADDGTAGYELWRTDDSAAGTFLVRAFAEGSTTTLSSRPDVMAGTPSGNLYLVHKRNEPDAPGPHELWHSSGTPEGTRRVQGLVGRLCGTEIVTVGERALFSLCEDPARGESLGARGLWRSDGTTNGTYVIDKTSDKRPATGLRAIGRRAYFQTEDPDELWVSDGTRGGTRRLASLGDGRALFDIHTLTEAGPRLFLAGDDGLSGYEPFTLLPARHFLQPEPRSPGDPSHRKPLIKRPLARRK